MAKSITPNKIKQNNNKLIYQYIYDHRKVSQQEICIDLRLSRPTVMTNLNQLEEDGYIEKVGQMDSDVVGRKAIAYGIVSRFKVAIGVELTPRVVKIIALDLYGDRIEKRIYEIPFENNDQYFRSVSIELLEFINGLKFTEEQILGISFVVQGLVSPDGDLVTYGKIMNFTGLSIDVFKKYLPYPCRFIHDADSAAFSEIWFNPSLNDTFFISVNRHIGGALIHDGQILVGMHGHSATFEHIPIRFGTEARKCYCGKSGCVDTISSIQNLLRDDEELDSFFRILRSGDEQAKTRWNDFLNNFGEVLNLLHLVYDADFIIGGYLAPFLIEEDIEKLHERISMFTPFEESKDFLHISKLQKHSNSMTIGGALIYIHEYLRDF